MLCLFLSPNRRRRRYDQELWLGGPDLVIAQHEPLRIEERRQSLLLHRPGADVRLQAITDTAAARCRIDLSSLPSNDIDFKILSTGSAVGSGSEGDKALPVSPSGSRGLGRPRRNRIDADRGKKEVMLSRSWRRGAALVREAE